MVKTENTVYEAILHWIAHAPWERGDNMAVLLAKVSQQALGQLDFVSTVQDL